ncbi:MAG: formyl transferase [Candidatus Zixiibacteriota bacterium]
MKIVCLIRNQPALIYFVNTIYEKYDIDHVFIETGRIGSRSKANKVKKYGIIGSAHIFLKRLFTNYKDIYDRLFQEKWKELNDRLEVTYVESINSQLVEAKLDQIEPDLLLDHGTSIVKGHILDKAGLALNLHWGLSPYYRGVNCTEWALINRDPYNIGVTIHRLTKDIDGGSIVAQKRIIIQKDDTVESINMRLTKQGTELLIRLIKTYKNQERPLKFHKQDFSLGFLTLSRQWSYHLKREIEYIEKHRQIAKMLKKPARKEKLPIIEL